MWNGIVCSGETFAQYRSSTSIPYTIQQVSALIHYERQGFDFMVDTFGRIVKEPVLAKGDRRDQSPPPPTPSYQRFMNRRHVSETPIHESEITIGSHAEGPRPQPPPASHQQQQLSAVESWIEGAAKVSGSSNSSGTQRLTKLLRPVVRDDYTPMPLVKEVDQVWQDTPSEVRQKQIEETRCQRLRQREEMDFRDDASVQNGAQ